MNAKLVALVSSFVVVVACAGGGSDGAVAPEASGPQTERAPYDAAPREPVASGAPADGGLVAPASSSDGGRELGATCSRSSECGMAFDRGAGAMTQLVCCADLCASPTCAATCTLPCHGNACSGSCDVGKVQPEFPETNLVDSCFGIDDRIVSRSWVDLATCGGGHVRTAADETFKATCESGGRKARVGCDNAYYCCRD